MYNKITFVEAQGHNVLSISDFSERDLQTLILKKNNLTSNNQNISPVEYKSGRGNSNFSITPLGNSNVNFSDEHTPSLKDKTHYLFIRQ